MPFDVDGALQSGATEDQILDHLTKTRKFDVQGALASGVSKRQVIDYLATTSPPKANDAPPQPVAQQFMGNLVKSGQKLAADTFDAVTSPRRTVASVIGLASPVPVRISPDPKVPPVGGPEGRKAVADYYKQRYGGIRNIKNTLFNDPAGAASDVSALAGGAGLLLKGAGAATKLEGLSRAAQVATEISDATNPMVLPGTVAKSVIPQPLRSRMGARFYQSALKPPPSMDMAEREAMIASGLENSIPVSRGGLRKTGKAIDAIDKRVSGAVEEGVRRGLTVNPEDVAKRVSRSESLFGNQVNPTDDLRAIASAKNEFLDRHSEEVPFTKLKRSDSVEQDPATGNTVRGAPRLFSDGEGKVRVYKDIPLDKAQAEKQGTYAQLRKKYGEIKGAPLEAQKDLARGLKEEVYRQLEQQYPDIHQLGHKEKALIDLEGALERFTGREGNKQLFSIDTPILASGAAAVSGDPKVALMAAAAKQFLDKYAWVKSRIGIAIAKKRGRIEPAPIRRGLSMAAAVDRPEELDTPE